MKIAVYPGSFDPFTLGHLEVLKSSLKLFDKIIVAVGVNILKPGYFSVKEKIEIIKMSTIGIKNIEIISYEGLTIDFCKKMGASFIIRGLRTTTDFEFESVISQANQKLNSDILTIFIPAANETSFISSTVVRDLLANGGDATQFLSPGVDLKKLK